MIQINKAKGLPSTEPTNMSYAQMVDINTICESININLKEVKEYTSRALKPIQESVYLEYIVFNEQVNEDEYLALETLDDKNNYLIENESTFIVEKDLHPNVKLLYVTPDETDIIKSISNKLESLQELLENLDPSFFNGISRLDSISDV